jgi:hypothetical protein
MKNNSHLVLCYILVFFLIVFVAIAGVYYGKSLNKSSAQNQQPLISNQEDDGQTIKDYTNDKLNFSLKYKSYLNLILEESDRVVFHTKDDDMTGFGVVMEKVPYSSTKDWLAAQPKGSAKGPGFEGVLWINHFGDEGNGTLLVDEYVQTDSDNGKPIYGKYFYGVRVKDGVLYKILSKNEFPASAISSSDSEMMDVYSSFQLLK